MSERQTLLEYAYHWEKTTPQQVYLTQPLGGSASNVRDYTWAQVMDQARRMASYLKGLGLPAASHIAICSKNCAHWVMADLAIWMAGHVTIPVYPILTEDTTRHILSHSEAKLLFVGKLDPVWDQQMKAGVPEGVRQVAFPLAPKSDLDTWDAIVAGQQPLKDPVARSADETATIIYTSGSTGVPKGAMITFGGMLKCCFGIDRVIHVHPGDRYLSYLPVAHAMERWIGECMTIYGGYHVFYANSLDSFVQDLQRARPTLFLSVPRLWLKFQRGVFEKMPPARLDLLLRIPVLSGIVRKKILGKLGLDQVRFAGSGSAPIPKEIISWYRRLGLELLEGYGMTENFNYSHLTKPGQVRAGFIGTPYHDVDCRLAEDGEVQMKGPGLMTGYYKLPEETRETFTEDGYLRTGDRGELDEIGRLKITGRTKEIFKTSKGKYVAPAPLENKLVNHPYAEMCCVSGSGFPQPHAVFMLSDIGRNAVRDTSREQVAGELKTHVDKLNAGLDPHERLQFVAVVRDSWMPENGFLTPTMKIRRAFVEDAYKPYNEKWYAQKDLIVWHD
ncbi:MAG: AMP-binding protein [Pseudomonadota bacterium]